MASHLIFMGPSTAGKSSLMLGLSRCKDETYDFTINKTVTTRPRRPGESDDENIFVDPQAFNERRAHFLFTFQTYPTYEYGIERQEPLAEREVRMRILMPVFAAKFRSLVSEPTLFCSIAPFENDIERSFIERDPNVDPADMRARLNRFHTDRLEADEAADICFANTFGKNLAVQSLRIAIKDKLRQISPG